MAVLGIGHDVVDVHAFHEQFTMPGTRIKQLFSVREQRQAQMRAAIKHDSESAHFAARWAGKEAVIKAWCEALSSTTHADNRPYSLDTVPWSSIEILGDSTGCPHIALSAQVGRDLRESLRLPSERNVRWHVALSHDGGIASAVVLLEAE